MGSVLEKTNTKQEMKYQGQNNPVIRLPSSGQKFRWSKVKINEAVPVRAGLHLALPVAEGQS